MSGVVGVPGPGRRRGLGELFSGAGYLFRGLGWMGRHPAQYVFGLVPAVITLVLYVVGLVLLWSHAGDLAGWLTPFADDWSEGARRIARTMTALAIFGAGTLLAILTFTAITLLIGDPFYERIAVRVEESQGGAPPEPDVPFLVSAGRAIKDTVVLGIVAVGFSVCFFALGFIPLVGQTVVPVVAACVGGYFLAGELTSVALERRGMRRRERFGLLKRNRMLVVGFGAMTFVLFLIPLGAVLVMPGAVAGATLLARERLAGVPEITGKTDGLTAGR